MEKYSIMERIVEINCLEHIYQDNTKIEICGISICIDKGEKVAILGPNGGGKTTLIKHILGLLEPSKGDVKVFGVNPAKSFNEIRMRIGVVLQSVEEQLIGPSVIEDIIFSPLNYGHSKEEALIMAEKIMQKLNITHLKDKIIHYLSGGEKRKVALAGALILNPELLVLDEPFSGLDMKSQKELIALINDYSKENQMSVLISTHDIESISDFADTMYLISKNDISQKGTPQELLNQKELLERFNLEEPVLSKIYNLLKSKGFEVNHPKSIEDLVNQIISK